MYMCMVCTTIKQALHYTIECANHKLLHCMCCSNPDVMLEAYFEQHYSPLFFFVYLVITFYFLTNVVSYILCTLKNCCKVNSKHTCTLALLFNVQLLAIVYGSFEEEEKKKFVKLFKHKLWVLACQSWRIDKAYKFLTLHGLMVSTHTLYSGALDKAYEVLASDSGICFYDFLMFMHYYQSLTREYKGLACHIRYYSVDPLKSAAKWQVMCIFKALHKDPKQQHQELSREDFYSFYEVQDLKWKQVRTTSYDVPCIGVCTSQ